MGVWQECHPAARDSKILWDTNIRGTAEAKLGVVIYKTLGNSRSPYDKFVRKS